MRSWRWIYEKVRAARTKKFRLKIKGYPAPVKLESKHDPRSIKRTLFIQSEKHSYRWIKILDQGVELDFPTYRRKHWECPSSGPGSERDLLSFTSPAFNKKWIDVDNEKQ